MDKIDRAQLLLKIVFVALPIIVGVDKLFFSFLADWNSYVAPFVSNIVEANVVMTIVAILEILLGLVVLIWTRVGAYISFAWYLLIAINLVILGAYDIAARDVVIAISAFSLAKLTEF